MATYRNLHIQLRFSEYKRRQGDFLILDITGLSLPSMCVGPRVCMCTFNCNITERSTIDSLNKRKRPHHYCATQTFANWRWLAMWRIQYIADKRRVRLVEMMDFIVEHS